MLSSKCCKNWFECNVLITINFYKWSFQLKYSTQKLTRLFFKYHFCCRLTPSEENKSAHGIFEAAFESGKMHPKDCRTMFPMCIFDQSLLFDMVKYLLRHPNLNRIE